MPAFLAPIIAKVGVWLTGKVGSFLGSILLWVFDNLIRRAWAWGVDKVTTWLKRRQRAKDQAVKQEAVEKDIESGAERTEEARKREQDWLNS